MSTRAIWDPAKPEQTKQEHPEARLLDRLLKGGKTGAQIPDPQFPWSQSNLSFLLRKLHASNDAIKAVVTIDPRVMHGNPVFTGTRIPIYEVVEELTDGTTLPEILEGYPSLRLEQIQHALDFTASLLRIYDDQIPD